MHQGDTVIVRHDAENVDTRWWEDATVPAGTVARVAGWRGLDGVVITWPGEGRTESAVVLRSDLKVAPRPRGKS